MPQGETIARNLEGVRERMAEALRRSGREPGPVRLVAVSKTWSVETIGMAVEAGQTLFGENKVQELQDKVPELPGNLEWHFIGHLQKNKVRKVLPLVREIETLDSLDLARQVDRIAGEEGLFPRVCLEVNLAKESSKHGFAPEELEREFEALLELERLEIHGLMVIPPFAEDAEKTRTRFAELRGFRDRLSERFGVPLPELSMGMSHDFEVAIEEGATLVRVGSAIFGARR